MVYIFVLIYFDAYFYTRKTCLQKVILMQLSIIVIYIMMNS